MPGREVSRWLDDPEGPGVQPCESCGERPATYQRCPGDGGTHYHGRIHSLRDQLHSGSLRAVCDVCYPLEVDLWNTAREVVTELRGLPETSGG
jgi:hypothetical protein